MPGVAIIVCLERQETQLRRCFQRRYGWIQYEEERSSVTVFTQLYLTCKTKLCKDCDPASFPLYIRIFRTQQGCPV